jgi:Flp pilus assembly protein TadG
MSRVNGKQGKHESGVTMTAAAAVTAVLSVLALCTLELGRGVFTKHTLSHVAREAARYASVRSVASDDPATAAAIEARAKDAAVGIDPAALRIETLWTPANAPGAIVSVRVSYDFEPVTPLIPVEAIPLSSNSERIIVY